MLSRITYTFRETWASFRRNMTLTVAAIITSAVSLLIFGLTLLMQQGFDNMLLQWSDDVEMVIYVNPGATPEQLAVIQSNLDELPQQIAGWEYCDSACAMSEAQRLLAGDPSSLQLLTTENIPTNYKVKPTDATQSDALAQLRDSLRDLPNVGQIILAQDYLDIIGKLQGFAGLYTVILSVTLLVAAVLLIWNTIRTAMFARRREIEVMKLVGATDWFIRIPFMLEGLIQGLLGGIAAVGAMLFINWRWSEGVQDFPESSGMTALVVVDGYQWTVAIVILAFGALVGMIGSGIAASRFLDV
jgi:cell division transport system permease protein